MSQSSRTWVIDQICWLLTQDISSAVLLDGPWGVGKTHLWRESIAPVLKGKGREILYLSLYGVDSVDRFTELIVEARLPYINSKPAKLAQKVLQTAADVFRASRVFTLVELWDLKKEKHILCVDDVERCATHALGPVMGHLTQLAERKGIPMLLIGNEEMISKETSYEVIKEKLIGHSFMFPFELETPVSAILDKITGEDNGVKSFLAPRKVLIQELLRRSPHPNFRALKIALYKFAAIYPEITKYSLGDLPVERVLRLLIGLCQEVANDAGCREELLDGLSRYIIQLGYQKKNDSKREHPVMNLQHRYFEPWLDTPPRVNTIVRFALSGDMPIINNDTVGPLKEPVAAQRRIQQMLGHDPSLSHEQLQAAVDDLIDSPTKYLTMIYEVFAAAELMSRLVASSMVKQDWQTIVSVFSDAMNLLATNPGRDFHELEDDVSLCSLYSVYSETSLEELSQQALKKSKSALCAALKGGIETAFAELPKNPHLFLPKIKRDYPWLIFTNLFTPDLVIFITPFLAECSDEGVKQFIQFIKERALSARERRYVDTEDYNELEGLNQMLDHLRRLQDQESSWRNISIEKTISDVRHEIENIRRLRN